MHDILTYRRHRFDALFTLLTGQGTRSLPQIAHPCRDVGLPEPTPPIPPAHDALGIGASRKPLIQEGAT
jgi:hypothetical protein